MGGRGKRAGAGGGRGALEGTLREPAKRSQGRTSRQRRWQSKVSVEGTSMACPRDRREVSGGMAVSDGRAGQSLRKAREGQALISATKRTLPWGKGEWVNLRYYSGSEKDGLEGLWPLCSDPFLSEREEAWGGGLTVCTGVPGDGGQTPVSSVPGQVPPPQGCS